MRLLVLSLVAATCAAADPDLALIDYQLLGRIGMSLQVTECVDTRFRLGETSQAWDQAWRVDLDTSYHHPLAPRRALVGGVTVSWDERDWRQADASLEAHALGLGWHVGALLSAAPHGSAAAWNIAVQPYVRIGLLWQDLLARDATNAGVDVHPRRYEIGAGVDCRLFIGRWLALRAGIGAQAWSSDEGPLEQSEGGTVAPSRFRGSELYLRGGIGVTF